MSMPHEMQVSPPAWIAASWPTSAARARSRRCVVGMNDDVDRGVEADHADDVAVAEPLDRGARGGDRVGQALAGHRAGAIDDDRQIERRGGLGDRVGAGHVDEQERLAVDVGGQHAVTEAALDHQRLAGLEVRVVDGRGRRGRLGRIWRRRRTGYACSAGIGGPHEPRRWRAMPVALDSIRVRSFMTDGLLHAETRQRPRRIYKAGGGRARGADPRRGSTRSGRTPSRRRPRRDPVGVEGRGPA